MDEDNNYQSTLAGQLRAIQAIPDYVEVNKDREYRKRFEVWAKRNSLARDVKGGRLSLVDEYNEIFEKYMGVKNLYPHFILEGEQKRIEELEQIIGELVLDKGSNLISNPPSCAGFFGLVGAGSYALGNLPYMNRRKFLKKAGICGGLAAFFGSSVGVIGSMGRGSKQDLGKINALYVQEIRDALYGK